jgi:hypothetical protein
MLGDEMCLGKTIQAIGVLKVFYELRQVCRILILCPRTLVGQWHRELTAWAPELFTQRVRGSLDRRTQLWRSGAVVFITNYETWRTDRELLLRKLRKFDLYVKFQTPKGGEGFIGIKVKYHENLQGPVNLNFHGSGRMNPRYDRISSRMGCFRRDCRHRFDKPPLHQVWRDHLLVGIHRIADPFDDGFFVFLYPQDNNYCSTAVAEYYSCLLDDDTFTAWTLEDVVSTLRQHTSAAWVDFFHDRYLNFAKLNLPSR